MSRGTRDERYRAREALRAQVTSALIAGRRFRLNVSNWSRVFRLTDEGLTTMKMADQHGVRGEVSRFWLEEGLRTGSLVWVDGETT